MSSITSMSCPFSTFQTAIISAILISVCVVVLMCLARTIRHDIAKYWNNFVDSMEIDDHQDVGWKLIYGDVFRSPSYSLYLACIISIGIEIIGTVLLSPFALIPSSPVSIHITGGTIIAFTSFVGGRY